MTARFILSLDCEGKWGVADHLGPDEHRTLSDARLRKAYADILALLDEYDVPATFAFVGLFGESPAALKKLRPDLAGLTARAPHYLPPAWTDMDEGSREGWHGDWAVDSVGGARAGHELALHGLTHVPWGSVDRAFAAAELEIMKALESPVRRSATFIYPRNEVAHVDVLAEAGFEGFRLAPPRRSRLRSLLSELNLFSPPEADPAPAHGIAAIPGGYFVNWRSGGRRLVPVPVSRARARRMLARAERDGRVVQYWTHPENIASAPDTLRLLRGIVGMAARARDAGRCRILTQQAYCRQLAPMASPA